MGRKRKATPAEKASARWNAAPAAAGDGKRAKAPTEASQQEAPGGKRPPEEPVNGDHFVISLALIGVVAIAAIVYITMQGGVPF